jgi:L-amino acid N-acyltransferase YncA
VHVRAAQPADAQAIAAVYNEAIEERRSTFETRPQEAGDALRWIERSARLPVLVGSEGGAVVGWARLSGYSERPCYAGVAEASVYLARAARGRGAGRTLLAALHAEAQRRGHWKLIGLLFPDNEPSVALFHAVGYRDVGTFHRHGRLHGAWRDVLLVELLIGEGAE